MFNAFIRFLHDKAYSLWKLFFILTAWTLLCLAWLSCTPKFTVAGENLVIDSDGVVHICPTDTLKIYNKIRVVIDHEDCGHNKKGGSNGN